MNVLTKIREVLSSDINEPQLDRFLTDVRDSLASTSRQFLSYSILIITSLVTYHLVVHDASSVITFNAVQFSNTTLFRRVFLIFPASLLVAVSSIGYLRRLQREVYDFLSISRYRALGKSGLHELRLPADYVLGFFVLRESGGLVGKVIGSAVPFVYLAVFMIGPSAYIIHEAILNLKKFGIRDALNLAASLSSIVLCLSAVVIVILAGQIKSE